MDPGQTHSFASKRDDPLDVTNFLARVAPLAAVRARWLDYLFGIEAPQKRRLDIQHSGDLANGVERREIVIERDAQPVAVLRAASPTRRTISACIALAKAHEEETGLAATLDPDFAADVEEIIRNRQPWNPPAWD